MDIGEMKAGIKGAITSLLFWLVLIYVPVVVIDVPALFGIDITALDAGDPVRVGILAFLWSTLAVAAVFGVITGVRGERQAAWAQRHRPDSRDGLTEAEKKSIREANPG